MKTRDNKNLKKKLKIFLSLFFILSIGVIFNIYKQSKEKNYNNFVNENLRILEHTNNIFLREYKAYVEKELLFLYSQLLDENLKNNKNNQLKSIWKNYLKDDVYLKDIYIIYNDKLIIEDGKEFDYKNRPWYKNAIKKDDLFWSEPYPDIETKKIVVTVTKHINSNKNNILAMDINLNKLSESLSWLELGFSNDIFLLNSNGKIMAHSNENLLNTDFSKTNIFKNIEKNKSNTYTDNNGDLYLYKKDSINHWTLVMKIPKNIVASIGADKSFIEFLIFLVIFIGVLYQVIIFIHNKRNTELINCIKALQNRDPLTENVKCCVGTEFYNEIKYLQNKIEILEQEVLRDEETGFYNQTYLQKYGKNLFQTNYKILIIEYLNLEELKRNYGKNIVELILKRGVMTFNALKEANEFGIRINKNTIGLILKNGNIQNRATYIADEIINYNWKLHSVELNIMPKLLEFEEYINMDG